MIFNNEKVLYWAKTKGEFQLKNIEKNRMTDCYSIVTNMARLGFLELSRSSHGAKYYKITKNGEIKLLEYQNFYKENKKNKPEVKSEEITLDSFMDEPQEKAKRVYSVYKGMNEKGVVVYIGTTIQKPEDRFRWHKANGKNLNFKVINEFDNSDDMLNKEFELITKLKPKLNKITKRKQNLNVKLTKEQLDARVDDKEWCQSCLKRRARDGVFCGYC